MGVLLLHALLLGAMPSVLGVFGQQHRTSARASFVTRTLTSDTASVPVPAAPAVSKSKPAAPAAKKPQPPAAPPAQDVETQQSVDTPAASAIQPANTAVAAVAIDPPANTQPPLPNSLAEAPTNTAVAEAAAASAAAAAAPVPTPATAPPAPQGGPLAVSVPGSIRLLYDGKGEERGFIKYAASAELLWLTDGAQYSARLEISAWGIRVRSWTSKGAVSEAGLVPLRFGDKPRGAEQATHFQRDKGIISFSANNPDVPLQDGAQDKLSALLQLGALLAGAPQTYSAGDSIRFQAADAHRAEWWDFKVAGLEQLDLPGGPKQALKLSKSPTVEFDQGIDVWLAPDMHYLPVRLRITEANGAFADLLWRKTQNAE
jgi:hypothetical protein